MNFIGFGVDWGIMRFDVFSKGGSWFFVDEEVSAA